MLGFIDEMPGLVEVDVIGGGGAVGIDPGDGAVEDVAVLRGLGCGGVRAWDADDVAEFGEEHLVVRPLGGPGGFPAGDEGGDLRGGGGHGVGKFSRGSGAVKRDQQFICAEARTTPPASVPFDD